MSEKDKVLNFYHELQTLKDKYSINICSNTDYGEGDWIILKDKYSNKEISFINMSLDNSENGIDFLDCK